MLDADRLQELRPPKQQRNAHHATHKDDVAEDLVETWGRVRLALDLQMGDLRLEGLSILLKDPPVPS